MSHHQFSYRLKVVADADPSVLPRVCGHIVTLSLIPNFFLARHDVGSDKIFLEIDLVDASDQQVDLLQRKLVQMTLVESAVVESIEETLCG